MKNVVFHVSDDCQLLSIKHTKKGHNFLLKPADKYGAFYVLLLLVNNMVQQMGLSPNGNVLSQI